MPISASERDSTSGPLPLRDCFIIALLALVVLLPGTIGVSLLDRDEGWYAQTAREMRQSGDWVVPTYQGEPWIAKPPLLYWLIGATYPLLGTHEFAARLPSLIAMTIAIALLADLTARLFGPTRGVVYRSHLHHHQPADSGRAHGSD